MKRAAIIAVLLLIAGAVAVWAFRLRGEARPLTLSGSVEARHVEVGPLVAGRVKSVLVDEGSRVRAGEPLVELEADLLAPQVKEQEAAAGQARSALERTLTGPRVEQIRRARIDVQVAETDRLRIEALFRDGIVPRQQYDAADAKAASARETLGELERGSRREDVAEARSALERQQQRLAYLKRQMEETVVRAPADGVVQSIDLRPGDLVQAGAPVAKILEPDQLWVRIYVPEPRLGAVRLGQKAEIRVDTYPDRRFPGTVVEIRDTAEYTPRNLQTLEQRSDQVFGVKVAIEPRPELKPGMAALVELLP